jgi:ribosome recycling factor
MSTSKVDDTPTREEILKDASRRMKVSIEFLKRDMQSVRTGRATPSLVENLTADYYGTPTPLSQMSTISAPDAQLIMIQPWDRQSLREIEKAILKSPTGLNPSNDGSVIRVPVPPLSQERRQELVKSLGRKVEDSKVAVRNVRRDAQEKLRVLERNKEISQDENQRAQTQLQKITDSHVTEIDQFWKSKVEEMLTV